MKKTYIQPQVTRTIVHIEHHLCGTSDNPKGYRYARWGSDYAVDNYGNPEWVNERYDAPTDLNNFEAIRIGGDNDGTLDSRGNEALW